MPPLQYELVWSVLKYRCSLSVFAVQYASRSLIVAWKNGMPWCTDSLTSVNIFWLHWRRVTSCVAQRDLAAISEQVETITKEAERLIGLFPDAQEHIAAKHEEMVQAWNGLVEKATHRKEKLHQAEQLQMYFNDYRELTWVVIVSFLMFLLVCV